MSDEPRRPICWFLWSRPDPHAPVDGDYTQVRAVRISLRGPIRLLTLVVGAAIEVVVTGTAVMAALGSGVSVLALLGAAIAASGLYLLLRGWVVGTYVTDTAVIIETAFGRRVLSWSDVTAVPSVEQSCPLLGLPLRVSGTRVLVTDADGHNVGTHVYSTSPDYWLRPEAFDMAALRLDRWHQDSPR